MGRDLANPTRADVAGENAPEQHLNRPALRPAASRPLNAGEELGGIERVKYRPEALNDRRLRYASRTIYGDHGKALLSGGLGGRGYCKYPRPPFM